MQISQRVFELLATSGKSQKSLADYLEFSQQGISNWKERNSDPPAKYISPIADFFGVSVHWLLTGEEKSSANILGGAQFNNRSISGGTVLQSTNVSGTLNINGEQKELSSEAVELIKIYDSLDVKGRHKLMDVAFKLEEEKNSAKPNLEQ